MPAFRCTSVFALCCMLLPAMLCSRSLFVRLATDYSTSATTFLRSIHFFFFFSPSYPSSSSPKASSFILELSVLAMVWDHFGGYWDWYTSSEELLILSFLWSCPAPPRSRHKVGPRRDLNVNRKPTLTVRRGVCVGGGWFLKTSWHVPVLKCLRYCI